MDLEEPWLVDVGFGRFSTFPLQMDSRQDQPDPAGTFRLVDAEYGDIDVLEDGRPQYRVEPHPRAIEDFAPMCWWQQTWPASHFRQSLVCSRLTTDGRVTLSGHMLIETVGGERRESQLYSDAEILEAYRHHFGIELDQVPVVAMNATTR